jgi:hypothetical protein
VGALLVGSQAGGVVVGLLAFRIVISSNPLVGVVEHRPDDLHAHHLGSAAARLGGLGLGRLGFRLGSCLLFLLGRILIVVVATFLIGFFVSCFGFLVGGLFFFFLFVFAFLFDFFFGLVGFFTFRLAAFGGLIIGAQFFARQNASSHACSPGSNDLCIRTSQVLS